MIEEHGEAGSNAIAESEIADAATGAENDRRALAIELAIGVPRIGERLMHDFQREQLKRIDRRDGTRRDAILDGIERDFLQEAAPLRVDAITSPSIGAEISVSIEAVAGDLGDRIATIEDVAP